MGSGNGCGTECVPPSVTTLFTPIHAHHGSAENGTTHTLNMGGKWSSAIFHELMELTAGPWWARWKAEQAAAGEPVTPPPQKRTGAAAVLP